MQPLEWTALSDQVREAHRPRVLRVLDAPGAQPVPTAEYAHSVKQTADATRFEVLGECPNLRTMRWSAPVVIGDLSAANHYGFRYRSRGLARSHGSRPVLAVTGTDAEGKAVTVSLLDAAEVFNDGLWHTVVGRKALNLAATGLEVDVSTEDSTGFFEFTNLSFAATAPELVAETIAPDLPLHPQEAQLRTVDLAPAFNDSVDAAFERVLDKHALVTDGAPSPTALADVGGIPFAVQGGGNNIIRPDEHPEVNSEEVEFAGVKTTRKYFQPPGRDDAVEAPIGMPVSEVFLVLCCELPKGGRRYAIAPGPMPYHDIGVLAVELQYADGQNDFAYPFSLADGGYAMQRMLGAYAVAADPTRRLESVRLHNHVFGLTFSLAAVTVNTSSARVLPALAQPRPPYAAITPPEPKPLRPFTRRQGERIVIGNGYYQAEIDLSRGFAIRGLLNHWGNMKIALSPASGLEVQVGDTILTGRAFKVARVDIVGTSTRIILDSTYPDIPVRVAVTVQPKGSPQLAVGAVVTNLGQSPLNAQIRLPVLREMTMGAVDDTWLCFPRYTSVVTDQPGFFISPNDRSFCMQFVDASNPREGAGLSLLTHNRDNSPIEYALGKNANGVTAFIQYDPTYYRLEPGQARELTETCLVFHPGDWHQAMAAYQEWLGAWYQPVRSQDKDWFRRLAFMRVHLTDKAYSWAIPVYDAESNEYRIDPFIAGDTEYMGGLKPEIVHLGGWCDFNRLINGDFLGGDYAIEDYTGGVETLKAAVSKLQDEHGIPVSVYMIPDRCSKESRIGKAIGEQAALVREDGSKQQDEHTWYVCTDYEPWRDHYIDAAVRTQRELGLKALYVDVFGYSGGHRCYSPDHGHPVPTAAPRPTERFIRRLREALPPDVAIWSEFPIGDVSSQYIDGNITYYSLHWNEYFGKTFDATGRAPQHAPLPRDLYRYVFPNVRQFVFTCGMPDWASDQKFVFFDAQALYDISWFLYAGTHLDDMRKALRLQVEYADCFASGSPTPDVPTERYGVHANAFPGEGRTAYTLYNTNYSTVRGAVLRVPHEPGVKYRDLWHDRPLEPEIERGHAVLSVALHPQELGCILQERRR